MPDVNFVRNMKSKRLVSVVIPTMNRADEVVECVKSVMESDYKNFEVIVVDNASVDDTILRVKKIAAKNRKVKLVESKVNLGAGGGRNLGAKRAEGEYLLFVDSDNVVDKKMIGYLVDFMENVGGSSTQLKGMVGPLTLMKGNPKLITQYFADINMWTSQAVLRGCGDMDNKQYDEVIKVGHLPNCFMLLRGDFEKVRGFEEKYVIVYEEADLAEKIKRDLNKNIYVYTNAITYHGEILPDQRNEKNFLGFRTKERAFLIARNRILFMKRNTTLLQKLVFFGLFNWLILFYYEFNLIKKQQWDKAWGYFNGFVQGFFL
jgi:hypothetical protein